MEKFLWSLAFLIFSHVLTTSCYILQSSSGSPLPIHVFINNNYKSIRNYFSIRGKARHLEIKSGHLAYFSSDGGERSLEYVCANTTALCQFQTDVHSDKDTADVSARAEVVLPLVGMTGVLKLCSAPSHIFKKQPLIAPSEIDCHPWIIPALPHHKEGYLLYPNSEVQDGCSLEVHTWFMTKSNYQEMRLKGTTEVFVPLFNKKWDLLLYAAFNAVLAADIPSCFVKTPHSSDSEWSKLQHSQIIHQTYKFKYNITAAAKNAGEYQIKCSGMNWNEPSQKTMKLEIKKSLKVTFIQGPKITLAGGGNTIAFPSHNLSGSFMLHIYTTSPINSLTFERSGDTTLAPVASDKSQFFAEMQYSSPFDILTEYRVGIPWLTDDLNGDYEVRVTNEDQESSTLSIRIIKAKALQVLVSPTHRSVGVGVAVSFECLAIGNLVQSISWKRDFESLQNGKYSAEIQEFGDGGNRQGVRLTLLKPQLQDSGYYTCIAVNRFETKEETVQLSVWLPGSPQIDPEYQADETTPRQLTTNHGARVLNLTDEQILQEYTHNSPRSKKSLSTIIGGIVGVLICVAVLGGATAALVFGYKWYKQRSQPIGREKTSRDRLESSKGYQQTDEELGLLDEEIGQQSAQTANGELERIDDTIQLDDIGGQSCDGEGEDESTPLLDKAAKKKSKDKRSRRPREKEETKGDKERGRINKAREEKGNGDKKEKRERSASTEEQQRTPRDGDKSGKRDKEIVTERNEEGPRDTDKLEKRDREKIAKERRKGEARDTDIAGIKDRENVEKERKREKRAVDLEERDRKETTKGGQRDNNKPETKDRDEIVKEKKAKDSNQAETKDRGDGPKEGKGDTDIPETKDREGTGKERKRREGKDINQSETKDRGERVKKRNKGDIDKAEAKDREKMKEREEKEADTLEVRGIEGTVKEKKREGPRDTDKGEAREGEETVTKRKKERLRDTDIPEIEDRGTETKGKGTETKKKGAESKDRGKDETKEKGAETKDREDKVKEKKRGDKGSKWRSREKDNL